MNVSSDTLAFAIVAASMAVGAWRGFGRTTAQLLIGCVSVAIGIHVALWLRPVWPMYGEQLDVERRWLALFPSVVFVIVVGCCWAAAWRFVYLNARAFEGGFPGVIHRAGGVGMGSFVGALLVGVLHICCMPMSEQLGASVPSVEVSTGEIVLRRYARFTSLGYREVREAFGPLQQNAGDDRLEVSRDDENEGR